jgi:hypothetical protein
MQNLRAIGTVAKTPLLEVIRRVNGHFIYVNIRIFKWIKKHNPYFKKNLALCHIGKKFLHFQIRNEIAKAKMTILLRVDLKKAGTDANLINWFMHHLQVWLDYLCFKSLARLAQARLFLTLPGSIILLLIKCQI